MLQTSMEGSFNGGGGAPEATRLTHDQRCSRIISKPNAIWQNPILDPTQIVDQLLIFDLLPILDQIIRLDH